MEQHDLDRILRSMIKDKESVEPSQEELRTQEGAWDRLIFTRKKSKTFLLPMSIAASLLFLLITGFLLLEMRSEKKRVAQLASKLIEVEHQLTQYRDQLDQQQISLANLKATMSELKSTPGQVEKVVYRDRVITKIDTVKKVIVKNIPIQTQDRNQSEVGKTVAQYSKDQELPSNINVLLQAQQTRTKKKQSKFIIKLGSGDSNKKKRGLAFRTSL